MKTSILLATMFLLAHALPVEAAQSYSGWICRTVTGGLGGTPNYRLDGSFYETTTGFAHSIALCPIPVDDDKPISSIEVHAEVDADPGYFNAGVFCRAELRSFDGGIYHRTGNLGSSIEGEHRFTLNIPALATPHFLLLRCSIGLAAIKGIRVY